jgi:nitrite reductase/ring-hydroxylating ferredoxin subunit
MTQATAANSSDVVEGKVYATTIDGQQVLLTRVQGKVCAFSAKCPHIGFSLARGRIEDGTIRCPWHGSRFDLVSGKNLDWTNAFAGLPMPKWSHALLTFGKKPAPLVMYGAEESNGVVKVTGPTR